MTRSRRFFASSPWIATGTPDYVNLGYTSRGLAKQALMRLSRKSLAIFRKLGLARLAIFTVMVGGAVGGIIGIYLSIPLVATLRVIYRGFPAFA